MFENDFLQVNDDDHEEDKLDETRVEAKVSVVLVNDADVDVNDE